MIVTRAGIIHDDRAKYDWLLTLTVAASCCWYPGCLRVEADVHHIVGGHGRRSDEFSNFALLCACHHHAYHSRGRVFFNGEIFMPLTIGELLALKKKLDPGSWNPVRLAQLRGQALPDVA